MCALEDVFCDVECNPHMKERQGLENLGERQTQL